MKDYSYLWNNLPFEERKRLMPYQIQSQILHIKQCKLKAERAHKSHIKSMNDHLRELEKELARYDFELTKGDKT